MSKAQVSMEYLTISAFVLTIVIIIFAFVLSTSGTNIRYSLASQSLDSLVKTADIVYARGYGTILETEITWPTGVSDIMVIHKCKEDSELAGCLGEQATLCTCIASADCTDDYDCIKYSGLQITMDDGTDLLYGSRSKMCINTPSDGCLTTPNSNQFPINNGTYTVRFYWLTEAGNDYIAVQGLLE